MKWLLEQALIDFMIFGRNVVYCVPDEAKRECAVVRLHEVAGPSAFTKFPLGLRNGRAEIIVLNINNPRYRPVSRIPFPVLVFEDAEKIDPTALSEAKAAVGCVSGFGPITIFVGNSR